MIRRIAILLLAAASAWAQEAREDEAACKKALEEFHKGYRSADEGARAGAAGQLARHVCDKSIRALTEVLITDSERVRLAAAQALGSIDDSCSVDALAQGVGPNADVPAVLESIAKALEKLDWEVASTVLNPLLTKLGDKENVAALDVIVPVLGKLGSPGSVEPLIHLLKRAENEAKGVGRRGRLKGNAQISKLAGPCRKALEEITGGREGGAAAWEDWWKANRERILASAKVVYRCRQTGKRWEGRPGEGQKCPHHDKPASDTQLVKTKLR